MHECLLDLIAICWTHCCGGCHYCCWLFLILQSWTSNGLFKTTPDWVMWQCAKMQKLKKCMCTATFSFLFFSFLFVFFFTCTPILVWECLCVCEASPIMCVNCSTFYQALDKLQPCWVRSSERATSGNLQPRTTAQIGNFPLSQANFFALQTWDGVGGMCM